MKQRLKSHEELQRLLDIEAALECVRARAMAMESSEELSDVLSVLFQQFDLLGISPKTAWLTLWNPEENTFTYRSTGTSGLRIQGQQVLEIDGMDIWRDLYEKWKNDTSASVEVLFYAKEDLAKLFSLLQETYSAMPPEERLNPEHFPNGGYSVQGHCKFGYIGYTHTLEPTEEDKAILTRFATEFGRVYQRFLDIKKAEAQAREAQIEAALERVRARTMAMHKTDELQDVINTVYQQFLDLKVAITGGAFIAINSEIDSEIVCWGAGGTADYIQKVHLPFMAMPMYTDLVSGIKKGPGFFQESFTHSEKQQFFKLLFRNPPYSEASHERKEEILSRPGGYTRSCMVSEHTSIFIINHHGRPFSEGENNILKRMGTVFEQTYTRFLDLQKAEAQAREAQIEAALERVRAATMAMHSSSELSEVAAVLFRQMHELGVTPERVNIGIVQEQEGFIEYWSTEQGGRQIDRLFRGSIDEPTTLSKLYAGWKAGQPVLELHQSGKELAQWIGHLTEVLGIPFDERFRQERRVQTAAYFKHGMLLISTPEAVSEESLDLLSRFGKVFEQTYTRFLDLQRAEAQAREAQIEAALERVRARTMAMHNTDDIADTVVTFFEELVGLGLDDTMRAGIGILSQSENMKVWTASVPGTGKTILHSGFLDMSRHPLLQGVKRTWSNGDPYFTYVLKGEDLKAYFHNLNEAPEYPAEFDLNKLPETVNHRSIPFRDGVFFAFTESPLPQDIIHTLERFAAVFGQTYTRYLDLERAEKQARESQIEAALERVRAKALAMHSSADLRQTITTLFEELKNLDVKPLRLGLGLLNPDKPEGEIVTSRIGENNEIIEVSGAFELVGDPILERVYDHFKKQLDYFPILEGDEITSYYAALTKSVDVEGYGTDTKHYGCFLFFPEGGLYAWAAEPHSEAQIEILKKFSRVVEITYRRYNDLIESEAREKEAVKQASLDRVRAEIASMRTTQDLERITPLVWQELTTLGIPFFRCGVFIMDEVSQLVHVYLTNPSGEALAAMDLPFDFDMSLIQKGVVHWRKQESLIEEWDQHQFIEMTKKLMEHGQVKNIQTYQAGEKPPERLVLHQVPFAQGMLYVGSTQALSDEEMDIVKALTRTFAVAYARYEDFRELEKAKQKVEKTLDELKATQAQLIHSEKMASLGELTAGIAHEIQNPLNFVNNFSEVSRELLEEMTEEIEKGDWAEVKALAGDVIRNLEKITHHGQRADSIVKGMLQHSRSSDGNKEPTDLNALADEYLRLAYHGLRARDKGFNASMVTEFDQDLPGVEVVPQDIGRVLLNLLTNAFHAVSERKKGAPEGFEPTVTVRTRKTGKGVEIQVADNGNGIPKSIREKIFQPFFTTKPTGQGTGLGLSLSYDIVKAHGGELSLTTKEGKGSTFFITFKQNS